MSNATFYPDIDPISIDRLTGYIERALLQTPQLRQVWVCGEVSSASHHPSGIYFNLKDKVGKSALPAVVWKSQIPELETKPEVGMEVLALGKIAVYAPHGKYQFQVQQVLPMGEGLQALRLQKLKQRLQAEGLFDLERKQLLPAQPQIIAVVTSPTAAAWGDIRRTLLARYPSVLVLFSPATVQGETAPQSIERAIDRVIIDDRAEVIILARGGGATEDLSCFNSEIVVRSIAECPIPIVTGIGHQRDESLADLAADVAAATPTAAAMLVVPDLADVADEHSARVERLRQAMQRVIIDRQSELDRLRLRCERIKPDRQLDRERERIDSLAQRLKLAIARHLQTAQQEQLRLKERCQALDPSLVLQRGYALVRDNNGAIVRTSDRLIVGAELSLQFSKGSAKVSIVEIDNGQKD
ncbi:exodeoxyribonuclease VII large subunit [Chamaesiphon polymorphus]|uniref:Exodeoxyribonuclease 7 large subunit n=1 Tax=Chamaesiphon polymorphus CCALA 037 TaxID=2107692 RepID=A0A2T1G0C8_9CYAN|nr:exodeoxyribonuclease VII large subunit [Chamaesiphon polymorphus]PSB50630.1 exodeoxyribonuclease VII large subunit [Chamaesiphon polymorphus CCALA 037]